jgi:hypothetical protein
MGIFMTRTQWIQVTLFSSFLNNFLALAVFVGCCCSGCRQKNDEAVKETEGRGNRLIGYIEAYIAKNGGPPRQLEDLGLTTELYYSVSPAFEGAEWIYEIRKERYFYGPSGNRVGGWGVDYHLPDA